MSCGGYPTCNFATDIPYLKEPHAVCALEERAFGNLLRTSRFKVLVGLHRMTWRTTCTALCNIDTVAEAVAWLIGDEEAVTFDRSTSYHGPEMVLLEATTSKKRPAMDSLARLGEQGLSTLRTSYHERYDDAHVLHFRLELHALLNGEVRVADRPGTGQVKGEIKVEVYPGQSPEEQLLATIDEAIERANRPEVVVN